MPWVDNNSMFVHKQRSEVKGTMDRSRTIGSPLCSLSVGEPGDPGCGDVGWNTEEETEKVTMWHSSTVVLLDEPGYFAQWRPHMEEVIVWTFRPQNIETIPYLCYLYRHKYNDSHSLSARQWWSLLWCLWSPSRKRKWSLLIFSPVRMSSIIHSSLWAWDWSWYMKKDSSIQEIVTLRPHKRHKYTHL